MLNCPLVHLCMAQKVRLIMHLIFTINTYIHDERADSTAWTWFLMMFGYYSWYCVNANQLPTPTIYYMQEWQDSLIQCSTSRCFVSIPIPWMYSFLLWTETVTLSISTFSALILAGIRRTGETQANNEERRGISTVHLFLPHAQIMSFNWMWTVRWLFKRDNICGGWDHTMIRWGALYSLFMFWCSFIFGAGILL